MGNPQLFSDFFENWVKKGCMLTEDGKYSEALLAFDNAFKYQTDDKNITAKAWEGRARVYDALERYDQALVASNEVIQSRPADLNLIASAWSTKGVALRHLGRYSESIEAFDQAILLNPDDVRTRQNKIFTLRIMNSGS